MKYSINNFESNNREFAYDLANIIIKRNKPILFLCIGSNKIVWDSIGSITGHLLKNYYQINSTVVGDTSQPVVSKNLHQTIANIKTEYYDHTIIVVDSAISSLVNLYTINLNNFGLYADSLNTKIFIGDVSISCNTWLHGMHRYLITPAHEKQMVFRLSNFISSGIYKALKIVEKYHQYNPDFCKCEKINFL